MYNEMETTRKETNRIGMGRDVMDKHRRAGKSVETKAMSLNDLIWKKDERV